ncbi:siderophore-interacting protein [Parafrigoribacterium soli]|uniref:siderophore-interacting protein n=1 Tax=Parafrigoribacterium soli TaxID=3144663 RepID=UPI0032ECD1C2
MLTLSPNAAARSARPARTRDARPAYRPYRVAIGAITRLSPHFTRVTFTGADLGHFGTDGHDQRIKIVIPFDDGRTSDIGAGDAATILDGTWYSRWRELPEDSRNPFRTYTIRAVRPEIAEVDVDLVAHGDGGPASRWLGRARVGDELVVVGPDSRSVESGIGIDWHPGDATALLLAGDETAAPAICSILESLPAGRRARAFIEIPDAADRLPVRLAPGAELTWLPRGGAATGSLLEPAVRDWVAVNPRAIRGAIAASAQQVDEIDVDSELLWDSPLESAGAAFYAWLAGEAGVIKSLRRFLVTETGIDRKAVAFMGYWRLGRAEAQ